jgi:uncharacterized protein YrzB (UPF0473 family)
MEEELEQGADIIVLKDEEGRDVRFEFLDLLEYDGEEYVILMQEDDDSGEVVILRLEGEDEEGEDYVAVEDEETLDQVYELFRKKHRDDYHFIDE